MGKTKKPAWTAADYDRAALAYSRRLPLEHFMEAVPQQKQQEITLESLAVLHVRRPEVQVFNEMLIQYFFKGRLRRVVPDNMVRLSRQAPQTATSFNVELETVQPLLVLEYVSPHSIRKDYKNSFAKYEHELKVPWCLMYYPDHADLRVWRHMGEKYEPLTANASGRYAILDLELEVAVQDGWVRCWHRGERLPLPGDLIGQLDQERQRADQERQQRIAAEAELSRLKALLAQAQGGEPGPGRRRKEK